MKKVSKDLFYKLIGKYDVHPYHYHKFDNSRNDYLTNWKLKDGTILGISFGDSYHVNLSIYK